MSATVDSSRFRRLFPALRRQVWLDTPGSPPAAAPVAEALRAAVTEWSDGAFQWTDWDAEPANTRAQFAELVAAPPEQVALLGSVAEAAATVAAALPPGRVVVSADEFRSNLLPWLALARDGGRHEVTVVPAEAGRTRSEGLVAALDRPAVLVAVSEVLSFDGVRADLPALRRAADRAGARLFVDASQSLGALRPPPPDARPDYLAVHGYKWLLCPRGAAWLTVRADRVGELRPLLPGWKSTAGGYFGPVPYAPGAAALDTSTAWLPWIGARAALRLLSTLDQAAVEAHCLRLAARFTAGAAEAGFTPPAEGPASQIVAVRVPDGPAAAAALRGAGVRAGVLGDRLRVGFHYFNDDEDVDRVLAVLRLLRAKAAQA